MEGFLTFIFITLLVLYLGGMLGKWLLRRWIMKKQEEFARRFEQGGGAPFGQYTWSSGQRPADRQAQKEGEVKVQGKVKQDRNVNRQVGDYVDYEEVDECRPDDN